MNSKNFSFGFLSLLCISPSIALAQERIGEVTMKSSMGGFKITSPGDVNAFGKIEMSFKGTMLIVGYEGTPIVQGPGLRVEYENKGQKRIEYFGKGTLTLNGKFRAIQFFGNDLDLHWVGMGICRVYGGYDKNGNIGTYEVKGDKLGYWSSGGSQFTVPPRDTIIPPKVRVKAKGSGG